jgi:hypothetical protein
MYAWRSVHLPCTCKEVVVARKKPMRVREPVQVYLEAPDLDLLMRLGSTTGLTKAELLRRGLRRLASDELTERKPGWSLDVLEAALGTGQPPDLAARHDHYLAEALEHQHRARSRAR